MGVEVKPGRWRMRNGETVVIEDREGNRIYPWRSEDDKGVRNSWRDNGAWIDSTAPASLDLVEYLGPEKPAGCAS